MTRDVPWSLLIRQDRDLLDSAARAWMDSAVMKRTDSGRWMVFSVGFRQNLVLGEGEHLARLYDDGKWVLES